MNTNKKLDNKGFSLVELIIVIAIMAILVGVVGTQVIPYIEKSRQSKDLQILSGFCTSMTSASSTTADLLDPTATYTITITQAGACSISANPTTAGGQTELLNNFCELNGASAGSTNINLKYESKAAKAAGAVTCVLTQNGSVNNGVVVTLQGQNKISSCSSK